MTVSPLYTTETPRRDGRVGRLLLHCVEADNGHGRCALCRRSAFFGESIRHEKLCPLPAACRALGYELPNINRNGGRTFKLPREKW